MEDNVVQKIKDKLDIVEVISGYLKLQKTGVNYRAICPFHSEKKPSFFVSPVRQTWRCFGCGEGGSVFDFIMKIEGIEFRDALRLLAQRAGVELSGYKPELKTERQRLYEICELAARFFEKQLNESKIGREVKEYLKKRGVSEQSIGIWRLGYAPDKWQALSDFLVGKGYTRQEIVKSGLAIESEKGRDPYDRFRARIMFPIFDINSQVVGFGGRILEGSGETAKYMNTPNTLLYDKSRIIYGLNFAKVDLRKKDFAILSEGYMDVILSHQAGFTNTVASSGTALTVSQLNILKRYTSRLYTAFDMDTAGGMATQKGIDLAQAQDFEIKVVAMPEGRDPADVISESPEQWEKLIDNAQNIFDFYFSDALSRFSKDSPEGKKGIALAILPKIKNIPNKIVQAHWVQNLAGAIKVGEEAVWEELKKITDKRQNREPEYAPASSKIKENGSSRIKTRRQLLEERILSLLFKDPALVQEISEEEVDIFSPEMKIIFSSLKKEKEISAQKIGKLLEKIEKKDDNLKKIIDSAFLMSEIKDFGLEEGEVAGNLKAEAGLCLAELKKIEIKERINELSGQIREAEQNEDQEKMKKLIEQFNSLAKQLN